MNAPLKHAHFALAGGRRGPQFIDLAPDLESVRAVTHAGLARARRTLPPWLFYDARGSALFEAICEQPEYYPTRTELSILVDHGRDIAATLGESCCVIELGSGSNRKARTLLTVMRKPGGYVAIDVSGEQLRRAVTDLARDFPNIPMLGIVADYGDRKLELGTRGTRRVGFFPGSTIGNMTPREALRFLKPWRHRLAGGGMLIGVDRVKDKATLDAAYNDAAGVTAAFNLNLLRRLNRELGADFVEDRWRHRAFFDEAHSRIEMHLVSADAQTVRIGDRRYEFAAGETIHTECSYKYTDLAFRALVRAAGFEAERCWTDADERFAVYFAAARP